MLILMVFVAVVMVAVVVADSSHFDTNLIIEPVSNGVLLKRENYPSIIV